VLVPVDDLADTRQMLPALNASGARLLFTSRAHFGPAEDTLR
jgi:hypothetical protein